MRVFVLCMLFASTHAAATDMATAIDGDTFKFGGQTVRIYGIDAPERSQQCGAMNKRYQCGLVAKLALQVILESGPVRCETKGSGGYSRALARCWAGPIDVGRFLVRYGMAYAYVAYSREYIPDQDLAIQGKEGFWKYQDFMPPWEWRAGRRKPGIPITGR